MRTGIDIDRPQDGFDLREAIDAGATIKVPIAQFEGAMVGFIQQLHALRSMPIDDPERDGFSLHRCGKPINDMGRVCKRPQGHAGRCGDGAPR